MLLTPHQRAMLAYIREFQAKRRYSPSLADLAVAFGVRSKNAVAKVVNSLVRAGEIQKDYLGRIMFDSRPAPSNPVAREPLRLKVLGEVR